MDLWWERFRRWPWWAQALGWVALWPVPLTLLALAHPERRRPWVAAAVAGSLVWLAFAAESATAPSNVAAQDEAAPATSTTTAKTSTTRQRSTSTTAVPTTTQLPYPEQTVPGVGTAPEVTGGLSTQGAGTFDPDALVAQLTIAPETDVDGYDRSLFTHWVDDDGDGCDTRAEVLQTESHRPVEVTSGCQVRTGWWLSIYDGYSTDDASELEIDHLVALHEAWQSGAAAWEPNRRRAFANDLGHPGALVAVTAAMNRSKSDRDPAQWQPPNRAAWCLYASDWITVKVRWGLTADQAEATALRNMLHGCGATTSTAGPAAAPPPPTTVRAAPVPVVPPAPAPTTTVGGSCDASYPGVCIPPAPPDLDCGDIPYRRFRVLPPDPHGFDGSDNDGLGCESG